MKHYKIANIGISISYQFNTYLSDNIEKYLVDDVSHSSYIIESLLKKVISMPEGDITGKKNPYRVRGKEHSYFILKHKNGMIKALYGYDQEFKHTTIELCEALLEDAAEMEYVLMSMIFMEIALKNGFMSLHASAIGYKNEAILFVAPSQTGKSTHTNYWNRLYPEVFWINDDKPLIKKDGAFLYVFGTPFSGRHKKNQNTQLKLRSIVFLEQGKENKVLLMKKDEISTEIIRNIHRPADDFGWNQLIQIINTIQEDIQLIRYTATHSIEAAKILSNYIYTS